MDCGEVRTRTLANKSTTVDFLYNWIRNKKLNSGDVIGLRIMSLIAEFSAKQRTASAKFIS